jgi:hypothetical protein
MLRRLILLGMVVAVWACVARSACAGQGPDASMGVRVGRPIAKIDPAMWGIFIEDLNQPIPSPYCGSRQ